MLRVRETFTDTAGTILVSGHTAEATWVAVTGGGGGNWIITDANRVRPGSGGTGHDTAASSGIPASAEYDVETDFQVFTHVGDFSDSPRLWGRLLLSAQTGYFVYNSSGTWILYRMEAGIATGYLGDFPDTLVDGQTYHVLLQIRNATKRVFINGVLRISSVDNTLTAVGYGGIGTGYYPSAATNSTGIHVDNFLVTDLQPEVGWWPVSVLPTRTRSTTPVLALTAPIQVPSSSFSPIETRPWTVPRPAQRRPIQPAATVAPLHLPDITVVAPLESWQGSAPAWLRSVRQTILLPPVFVQSFDTSAQRTSDTRPTFSMSVPYRMELLQYQTLVGPVDPIPGGSGVVGGAGRLPQAMGVPYKLELLQYQAIVGPVRLADVTIPSIAWAPQLVSPARSQTGWGTAVASGLTPPGPV